MLLLIPISTFSLDNQSFRLDFLNKIAKTNDPKLRKSPWYKRVMVTLSCGDCDYIPKVENAGSCYQDDDKRRVQVMHNGIKVVESCYYGGKDPWMTNIIRGLRGHHEPQEERAFYEMLQYIPEDAVMIELGSYWAYYSLWFLHGYPTRHAILIEPSASRLNVGQANFKLNGQRGDFIHGFIRSKPVELNTVINDRKLEKIHILHSDIQGHELSMLRSIKKRIREEMIDWIFVSTHSNKLHKKCLDFLVKNGMSVVCEHNCSESYSYDGLIVCKRPSVPGPSHIEISKRKNRSEE